MDTLAWAHSSPLARERNPIVGSADEQLRAVMITERHRGGGRLAQGLEVERPGKGRTDRGYSEKEQQDGELQAERDLKGLPTPDQKIPMQP